MSDLEFVPEVPKRSATRNSEVDSELQAIVDALKARPGDWAKVGKDTPYGKLYNLRNFGCEVMLRQVRSEEFVKDGKTSTRRFYDVYAKWPTESEVPQAAETKAEKAAKKNK
jgi:hypothetical protein